MTRDSSVRAKRSTGLIEGIHRLGAVCVVSVGRERTVVAVVAVVVRESKFFDGCDWVYGSWDGLTGFGVHWGG